MNWNSLLILFFAATTIGCSNGLRFGLGEEGGKGEPPPGSCRDETLPAFQAPPSLLELGQNISLNYEAEEITWIIQNPNGENTQLKGNSSYTAANLGNHRGRLEAIDKCSRVNVLYFDFNVFLPIGESRIMINAGDEYTSLANVTLSLFSEGATEMYITESAGCNSGGSWQVYNSQRSHILGTLNANVSVYAKFRNPVGNESQCVSASIIHDDVNPVVNITSGPDRVTNQNIASFTMSATDNISGVDTYFCMLDSGQVRICGPQFNYNNLNDGSHSFSVRVSDKAGNLSDWQEYVWMIDTVKPEVRWVSVPDVMTNTNQANFEFTGSDQGSGIEYFECSLNSGVYTQCSSPHSINVVDGSNTIKLRAKDFAGNYSDEISHGWTVDTEGPQIQITSAPSNPTHETEASFSFSVTDSISGVDQILCSLNQSGQQTCFNQASFQNLDVGHHSFTIYASDRAGNQSSLTYDWEINDRWQDQPIVISPGAGATDIIFVMDNTGSMYGEYRDQIDFQMRDFLSRIGASDYRIGVITGDSRTPGGYGSYYRGGRLVPFERPGAYVYHMDADNAHNNHFISTLSRREVTCVYGTWTGPNGRFCGRSGWNLPIAPKLIESSIMALDEPHNDGFFRDGAALNIIMVSDGNEVCTQWGQNGLCDPSDTTRRPEGLINAVQDKWPGKEFVAHSLIWRDQDRCGGRGGQQKGHTYEYLSQLTGGISRSICDVNRQVGRDLAQAVIDSAITSFTLRCEPVDLNGDGVIDENDIEATYSPDIHPKPSLIVNGDQLRFDPMPPAGTSVGLRYLCP